MLENILNAITRLPMDRRRLGRNLGDHITSHHAPDMSARHDAVAMATAVA